MTEESLAERRGEVDTTLEVLDESVEDHEERITRLERYKEFAKGGIVVLALTFGSSELISAIELMLA